LANPLQAVASRVICPLSCGSAAGCEAVGSAPPQARLKVVWGCAPKWFAIATARRSHASHPAAEPQPASH
jgi:hypothetical protein